MSNPLQLRLGVPRRAAAPLAFMATAALALSLFPSARPARSIPAVGAAGRGPFKRVALFDVPGSLAEIVAATVDGQTLIYTDAESKEVGFVGIANPASPVSLGALSMPGEPTSVATHPNGQWALVCVRDPHLLVVIDLSDRSVQHISPLDGQPDSITVSKDGKYAAIAIENERNEGLNSGRMPQGPAGFLTIVDLDVAVPTRAGLAPTSANNPATWTLRNVSLAGLNSSRFPTDPEPEFIDINDQNLAAITLQENNHVVLVSLPTGQIVNHWTAGTTTQEADTVRDSNILFNSRIVGARREPDAIQWTPAGNLITANEGDYTVDLGGQFTGGRGFTIFSPNGAVVYNSGAELEREAVRHSHYPEARSNSKGIEAEGAEIGTFGSDNYAFVGSERGNFVGVYRIANESRPEFVQLLPTGFSPEGLLAIPQRNLFVTANESTPGTLAIFQFSATVPGDYPDVTSLHIPWAAISGFANQSASSLWAVPDAALQPSRIFQIALGDRAQIMQVVPLAKNYDLEGIAINRRGGGWWVVSEGAGNGPGAASKNLLVHVRANGTIAQEVQLPAGLNAQQVQFGFEGVDTDSSGSQVYVAFQREWGGDTARRVRIGRYTPATGQWAFYYYPIEAAPSISGAWVGLSEISRINDTTFAVIERDNQARRRAQTKRVYKFSIAGVNPVPYGQTPPVLTKTLVRDLLVQDRIPVEKAEAMAYLGRGEAVVVTDNDGVGETHMFRFFAPF